MELCFETLDEAQDLKKPIAGKPAYLYRFGEMPSVDHPANGRRARANKFTNFLVSDQSFLNFSCHLRSVLSRRDAARVSALSSKAATQSPCTAGP